ncbi:nuclear RNA export factor 1-like isoform X2 [Onthophagus taurus]|nr:nuclear RNA export factor 1-like [Onthophagus taurus]
MKNPEINQFNLNSGLLAKHKSTIYSNATWHKIEVENAMNLERDTVLRTLMNFVHPLDFIPVCYETKGSCVSFLLKNCGAAIERLCRHNLIVTNPQDASMPFKIKIILKFAYAADLKINIQNNIISVLNKRYHAESSVLNLEMFYKDPDLIEFCTLSQPKLMFYVLHLSRSENRPKHPKSIKLSNNEIEILKPLEALFGLKSLTSLDLRNNRIKEIDASYFKDLNITELWLDGNPICDDYDEYSYPRAIREMIPTLEKLDGVFIKNKGVLPFRRNFLCSSSGHDLVDQFMEHYFNLYDTTNRNYLDGVYHKEAMFSMSAHYLGLQSTSLTAKLSPYKKVTRNLKMMSDFSKNDECLFRGRDSIVRLITQLPLTEHDPNTFTVDLMSYTETAAVLVIAGVFREVPQNLLDADRILGFSRVFVLLAGVNDEYSIVNEQLHVYNATSAQVIRSFKQPKISRPSHIQIPPPKNIKEQVMLAEALVSLTGLDIEWATKCLEECQFDFKRSLELFVDLFKLDKIPANAFR